MFTCESGFFNGGSPGQPALTTMSGKLNLVSAVYLAGDSKFIASGRAG